MTPTYEKRCWLLSPTRSTYRIHNENSINIRRDALANFATCSAKRRVTIRRRLETALKPEISVRGVCSYIPTTPRRYRRTVNSRQTPRAPQLDSLGLTGYIAQYRYRGTNEFRELIRPRDESRWWISTNETRWPHLKRSRRGSMLRAAVRGDERRGGHRREPAAAMIHVGTSRWSFTTRGTDAGGAFSGRTKLSVPLVSASPSR